MNAHDHMIDAIRYAFIAAEESKKRADKAKKELIQTLKMCGMFILGCFVSSVLWLLFTIL